MLKKIIRIAFKFFLDALPTNLLRKSLPPEKLQNLWFTQAFNGQIQRAKFIASCLESIKFSQVIETGTYLGNSTIALASLSDLNVHSIEIKDKFYNFTQHRIATNFPAGNIHLYLGSSDEILKKLLGSMKSNEDVIFLYLDAHWGNKLPFQKEISILSEWGGEFMAVIDDFKVTNDEGYGFDSYGDNEVSNRGIVVAKNLKWFSLDIPSKFETGARRGTGILIHENLLTQIDPKLIKKMRSLE